MLSDAQRMQCNYVRGVLTTSRETAFKIIAEALKIFCALHSGIPPLRSLRARRSPALHAVGAHLSLPFFNQKNNSGDTLKNAPSFFAYSLLIPRLPFTMSDV